MSSTAHPKAKKAERRRKAYLSRIRNHHALLRVAPNRRRGN